MLRILQPLLSVKLRANLLGQGVVPQASTSFGPPKFCSRQLRPPNCATGFVQVLDLERVLPPQVTGHAVHCVH